MGKSKLWDRGGGVGVGIDDERCFGWTGGVTGKWGSPEGVGASQALLGVSL